MKAEPEEVRERYARRARYGKPGQYSMLNPEVWLWSQERQRALIGLLKRNAPAPVEQLRVLEIGCGSGGNLLELIRLGFDPANLVGVELLPERAAQARHNLPQACRVHQGDASQLKFESGSFDIVYQSTVFTSLLDDEFQEHLAAQLWSWVKSGGAVLWYDFVYNNPANPDVRGVPLKRLRKLFPQGEVTVKRITLAPPISRRVSRVYPFAYHVLNAVPWLRTHVLCWIGKRSNP